MIRKIIRPTETKITIEIPENYVGNPVEVLAFIFEGEKEEPPKKKGIFFSAVDLETESFKFNRRSTYER